MDRRRFLKTVALGAGATLGTAGVAHTGSQSQTFETRDGQTLVGLTPPTNGADWLDAFESWSGVTNAVMIAYADFGIADERIEEFLNRQLTYLWDRGHVPHVIWQPQLGGRRETPGSIPRDIADGNYDETLTKWARSLRRWLRVESGGSVVDRVVPDSVDPTSVVDPPARRVYLNLAPEMNGDWVPWSSAVGGSTPGDYVDMWRRIYDEVMGDGVTDDHVQWVWTPNIGGQEDVPITAYYPGDSYVDWIGVHGYNWYNWGGWTSPEDIYGTTLDTVRALADKPIVFSEFGCSSEYEEGFRPERKAEWIDGVFDVIARNDVRMACWFNVEGETDWGVFDSKRGTDTWTHGGTTYNVYSAYRKAVNRDGILPAYPDNPRRLTTTEFKGAF